MEQIRHIIAAVGQFPQDDLVLSRAAEIARTQQARLSIIHVIDTLSGFDFVSADMRRIQQQMRLDARASIEAAVAKRVAGIAELDIRIETGLPSLRLIELTDEINADLVVMRAHQGDSIVKKIVGSTTDRVVRASRVPVLVVKRPVTQAYQRVLVSIDVADDSAAVVPFVSELLPLAALTLIHVVQLPHQFEAAMRRAGFGHSVEHHRDALVRKAEVSLHAMTETLEHRPASCEVEVVAGNSAATLVRVTQSSKVDLIALGPGSRGVIRRALLGSVTRQVLQDASCDVLICRLPS